MTVTYSVTYEFDTRAPLTHRPEVKPIVIGLYTLTATGLTVTGRPSYDEHEGVGDFIRRSHRASGFWLADWIAYGDGREDWRERIDPLIDAESFTEATVKQYRYVAKNVPPSRRLDGASFSLHCEVAGLDAGEQVKWLKRAKSGGWSVRDLRANIRAANRTIVMEGQALLAGRYRVVYADPDWSALSVKALSAMPVAAHAQPNAVLFLWVPGSIIVATPGPREVLEAWDLGRESS